VDCFVDLGSHRGVKRELRALLGGKGKRMIDSGRGEAEWFGIDWLVCTHGTKDARVRATLVLDIFGMGAAAFVSGGDKEGVVVHRVVGVQPESWEGYLGGRRRWRGRDINRRRRGSRGNRWGAGRHEPRVSDREDKNVVWGWRGCQSGRFGTIVWAVVAGVRGDVRARGSGEDG
jgi:hypothetical protein